MSPIRPRRVPGAAAEVAIVVTHAVVDGAHREVFDDFTAQLEIGTGAL